MKQSLKGIQTVVIVAALISSSSSVLADQQPKSSVETKRTSSKPSMFQSWRNGMRSSLQDTFDFSKYIRGNGPPRYN